jgi:hypothetical protein
VYGFYKRPDEDAPVVLLANDDERAAYEAKGFEYLGEAPAPGTSTPEEVDAARAKVMRKSKAKD